MEITRHFIKLLRDSANGATDVVEIQRRLLCDLEHGG
jgi:hypothetical protein